MSDPAGARRRLFIASAIGAACGLVVLGVVLANGHADLLRRQPFGTFFDAQARSLLHGHWDVPASEMFIEGYRYHGKVYQYFGAFPAVLRMPVLAVSDELYGRLTQVSMLLAAAVAFVGFTALHWRVRQLIRPGRPVSPGEAAVVALTTFGFGVATSMVFLASRAWVYHEAILWSVAWALLAFERLLAYTNAPSGWRLAGASAAAALAFGSRGSVGAGPVVAIALVLVGQLVVLLHTRLAAGAPESTGTRLLGRLTWLGPVPPPADRRAARRRVLGLAVALAVPVLLYASVNYSRFGSPYAVPWTNQLINDVDSRHRMVMEANNGSYFSVKFAPTTLLQYLRPDALAPNGLFPWLSFPRFRTPVIGSAVFDTLDPSSSIPASMPAVTLLAVVGIVAALRTSFARSRAAATLRVPLIGAAAGTVLVICISYVAERYLGDFLPFLVIAGLAGLQALLRRREEQSHRRVSTGLLWGVAVLAIFSVWANTSLSVLYQRLYNPTDPSTRASMLAFQYDVGAHLPGAPRRLVRADRLPATVAGADTTVVVGDCASVYWSDGRAWHEVEGTRAGGWYRLRARFAPDAGEERQPLLGQPGDPTAPVLTARRVGGQIEIGYGVPDGAGGFTWSTGTAPAPRSAAAAVAIDLVVDRALGHLGSRVDGVSALDLSGVHDLPAGSGLTLGAATAPGVAPRFTGRLQALPPKLLVCPAVGRGA